MNLKFLRSHFLGLCLLTLIQVWLGIGKEYLLAAEREQALSIVGGTVILGTESAPIQDAVINIVNGRIKAVGPRSSLAPLPRARAKIIEASGKWVLPGLIDAHIHFAQSGGLYTRPDVIDLRHVRSYKLEQSMIRERLPFTFSRYLCSGITSVVDVGGPLWTIELANTSNTNTNTYSNSNSNSNSIMLRPSMGASGPLLSNYSPLELQGEGDPSIIKLTTTSEVRLIVKDLAERGANFIKLWMIDTGNLTRTMPVFQAAIEEAHQRGLRVFAHATELETAKKGIRLGVDVLVHAIEDRPVDAELLTLLRERKVITISTLAVHEGYDKVLSQTANITDFMNQCGDPEVMGTWAQIPLPLVRRPRGENLWPSRNLKRLVDEGLMVAAGSDAGNIGTLHGPGFHRELELLAKAGLSPLQIIRAATQQAAQVLSPSSDVGTIEAGKKADLLIIRQNPLEDIRHLQKIDHVILGGEVVENFSSSLP